ncbi:unnamed protein product [Larinioides sclopetarius]|uniref:Uncharacterized protein n=1 Tax=Larinioides sclopetarius TaxID=280406 RepID=A0AAV2B935_9ARAC
MEFEESLSEKDFLKQKKKQILPKKIIPSYKDDQGFQV